MTSSVERNDIFGYTVTTVTNKYVPYQERPPFLVEGILRNSMNLLYGEAKTGKSTLAAALASALANGRPDFLGKPVSCAGPISVGVIAGDFDDDEAYSAQFVKVLDDGIAVKVYGLDRPPADRTWEGLQRAAREAGHGLVVVDNLTSFVDGSLSDDVAVNRLYDQLDPFLREGAAVLAVAHTSEKYGEHGKSKYPMGSSAIRARARWLCRMERRTENMLLAFEGNYDAPHEMTISLAEGEAKFTLLNSASSDELTARRIRRQRNRGEGQVAKRGKIRDFILAECQGMNGKDAAQAIAAALGGAASTHAAALSRRSYGVARVEQTGLWIAC